MSNSSYHADCNCVIYQNCTIIPPVIPPSGNCSFTCEDVQNLQSAVANLTIDVQNDQDDIDMLITLMTSVQSRLASIEATLNATASLVNAHDADLTTLFATANAQATAIASAQACCTNSQADAVAATLESIRVNGMRLGDIWWFGAQYNQLFAIDTRDISYYRFQQGVNATL